MSLFLNQFCQRYLSHRKMLFGAISTFTYRFLAIRVLLLNFQ